MEKTISSTFSNTKDTAVGWFQTRINHRTLGINYLLFKMKLKQSLNVHFEKGIQKLQSIYFGTVNMSSTSGKLYKCYLEKIVAWNFILQ